MFFHRPACFISETSLNFANKHDIQLQFDLLEKFYFYWNWSHVTPTLHEAQSNLIIFFRNISLKKEVVCNIKYRFALIIYSNYVFPLA
jgi:hypothetical protein